MTRKEDNEEESICHDSDASSSKSKIPKAKIIKTILKSLAVCGVTHVLADVIFRRVLGKRYHQFSKTDQIYLAERIPSTMHGLGVGLAALYVIFVKKAFKHGVFQPYPLVLDHVFAASVGYTIYDMVTMLFQEQPVEMWIHHVLSLLGTLLMMIYRVVPFFPTAFLITELTVFPNNAEWYIKHFSPQHLARVRFLRLVFVLLFRTFIGPWSIYKAVSTSTSTSTSSSSPPISTDRRKEAAPQQPPPQSSLTQRMLTFGSRFYSPQIVPPVVSGLSTVNILFLSSMNLIWTKGLARKVLRSR